jgi:hypothetical protein
VEDDLTGCRQGQQGGEERVEAWIGFAFHVLDGWERVRDRGRKQICATTRAAGAQHVE